MFNIYKNENCISGELTAISSTKSNHINGAHLRGHKSNRHLLFRGSWLVLKKLISSVHFSVIEFD